MDSRMEQRLFPIIVVAALSLTACNNSSNNNMNVGGGGTGGSSGGGTGGSSGGGTGGSSGGGTGSGTGVAVRGLTTGFDKRAQVTVPVQIFELPTAPFVSDDRSNSGVTEATGTLTLGATPQTGDAASLNVTGAPSTTNGEVAQSLVLQGDRQETQVNADAVADPSTTGDRFDVRRIDLDGDGDFSDFFSVEHNVDGFDPRTGTETISIYYGGNFASQAEVTALGNTATFFRAGGARLQANQGEGIVNASPGVSTGDVTIDADFTANTVNGAIRNLNALGGQQTNFDILLENATINGVHYDGGTARIVDKNTSTAQGTTSSSGFRGSFLAGGSHTGGVFQHVGTRGGEVSHVTGAFVADKQ